MFEIIKSGGWLMWPIMGCSVTAMTIVLERAWMLRRRRVVPPSLMPQVRELIRTQRIDHAYLETLRQNSPLGRILAAGLAQRRASREIMKESIEDTGRQVVAELERYLYTLGTIVEVTPLLGLLGTIFGMIQTFNVIASHGVGNPTLMAGGIAVAMITTAGGISVAVPALFCHRYFQARVDTLVMAMEQEALYLVEIIHGERMPDLGDGL